MTTVNKPPFDMALDDIQGSGGIKVHSTVVQGRTFDVYVNRDGDFLCSFDGRRVDGESLTELREKINGKLNQAKVRISIPVTVLAKGVARHGTVIGVTVNNDNFSIVWDDGKLDALPFYNVGYGISVFRQLDPDQTATLVRLASELQHARSRFEEFSTSLLLDLRDALRVEFQKQHELLNASTMKPAE